MNHRREILEEADHDHHCSYPASNNQECPAQGGDNRPTCRRVAENRKDQCLSHKHTPTEKHCRPGAMIRSAVINGQKCALPSSRDHMSSPSRHLVTADAACPA